MRLPRFLRRLLLAGLKRLTVDRRPPDFVIGGQESPYLRRWWVIPRNRWLNIYFHHFCRSDDDRALHDHPWWSMSILLEGAYIEHVPGEGPDGRPDPQRPSVIYRPEGTIAWRGAEALHRVELMGEWKDGVIWVGSTGHRIATKHEKPVWTLFITGPRVREWGFACPQGWRHHLDFVDPLEPGRRGRGCD